MAERYLIVSNPPHESSALVPAAAALGMSAADFRIKANFPAPEIWSAHADLAAAREQAGVLLAAGLRVALVPASVVEKVPAARHASALSHGPDGFTVVVESGSTTIGHTDRVVVVSSESVPHESRPARSSQSILTQQIDHRGPLSPLGGFAAASVVGTAAYIAADRIDKLKEDAKRDMKREVSKIQAAPAAVLALDIYSYGAAGWQSARLFAHQTDFSGLGALKQPTGKGNFQKILDTFKQQFENARIDERLVKVSHRSASVGGVALSRILGEASAQLAQLQPMDLASRLAFLTSK
jgi:hypothetical protein